MEPVVTVKLIESALLTDFLLQQGIRRSGPEAGIGRRDQAVRREAGVQVQAAARRRRLPPCDPQESLWENPPKRAEADGEEGGYPFEVVSLLWFRACCQSNGFLFAVFQQSSLDVRDSTHRLPT